MLEFCGRCPNHNYNDNDTFFEHRQPIRIHIYRIQKTVKKILYFIIHRYSLKVNPTSYTAEQAEAWCWVSFVAIHHTLSRQWRHRYDHGNGLMELPPARLHSHYRAEGGTISYDFLHSFIRNGLGLLRECKII